MPLKAKKKKEKKKLLAVGMEKKLGEGLMDGYMSPPMEILLFVAMIMILKRYLAI